jgi:hypothetical protein
MDASDVIRRIRAQTAYNYTVETLRVKEPYANISSPIGSPSTVKINYTDFDQRYNIALGKFYANGYSTIGFGVITNGA